MRPELKKIWIDTFAGQHELRLDWSNDRHQAIRLTGLDAESVEKGLFDAAELLQKEQRTENL